jgi:CubicO group peptidase (beta-lactamase class C family)
MKYLAMALLLALVGGGCRQTSRHRQIQQQLDSLFGHHLGTDGPGGAVLVAKNKEVIFSAAYGLADLHAKTPITTQTLFNLGSISKTFVGNAILILQHQGKLSLNDSLAKYFPHFKNKTIAQKVTIRHLLTHTSGLPDNRQVAADSVFYLTARDAENWYPVTQADSLLFEPGSRFEYSNPAFNGLALIVEQVSGQPWQQFVTEQIMRPAGMTTSTITNGPHPTTGVAHGYSYIQNKWTEDDYGEEPTFAAAGNGGVWSSVEELLAYESALQAGIFLPVDVVQQSRRVQPFANWADSTQPFMGWSWFVGRTVDDLTTVGHTGSQGGFLCNYVTIPDKGIVVIMLANFPFGMSAATNDALLLLQQHQWLDF